jgi:hypothetical protein
LLRKWLFQYGCGILRDTVGIVSENPRYLPSLKNLVLFLQALGKKKTGALLNAFEAFM